MRRVEREQGLGLAKEGQIKVGCCGFVTAQKKYFDPFKAEPLFGSMDYFRLHGAADYVYTYTDKELEVLRKKISEKPTYIMFNNNTMKEDGLRFMKLLQRR